MSAPFVRYEIWKNGRLAAERADFFLTRAHILCGELAELAERWRQAGDLCGEDFPEWSCGDAALPAFVRDLAERAQKVTGTRFEEYSRALAERVARGDSGVAHAHRRELLAFEGIPNSQWALNEEMRNRFAAFGGGQVARMGNTYGATESELESLARDVDKLEAVVGDLAERVRKARGELQPFEMRLSLQAAAASAAEAEAQRDARDGAEEVSRVVETLSANASDKDRAAIEARAQEAAETRGAGRRGALLLQLRLDIQRANEAGSARQRAVRQVQQWRDRLVGLEGPEVAELDGRLRRILDDGVLPQHMAQEVDGVVARATEASNRDYALGVIREELENLGYVAEVGFETAAPGAQEMLLRSPGMEDDYLVSLNADPGAPLLGNKVVREAAGAGRDADTPASDGRRQADERMQRTWCHDLAAVLAAAERRGVRGRAVERMQPGAAPVPAIAPLRRARKPASKRRRKRKGKLAARQLR